MPSLILGVCDAATSQPMLPDPSVGVLRSWAASAIEAESLACLVPSHFACDVVLVSQGGTDEIAPAVESVLAQDDVYPILHLVADGAAAAAMIDRFANRADVRIHHFDRPRGNWACLQELIPRLETPYLAIQTPQSISQPTRLATAIAVLEFTGAEIYGAAVAAGDGTIRSRRPDANVYRHSLLGSTLVMRRGTLVDMGGFDVSRDDATTELVHRAACEGRRIAVGDEVAVVQPQPRMPVPLGASPTYRFTGRSHRSCATGFPRTRAACDVVLPFRDNLPFVREALAGLLAQEHAELVIHLVDDASHDPVDRFLEEWRQHPAVRLYRNGRNLGPFATFNNVSAFAETPYIAVQDADDISLPSRIAHSCHVLETSGADLLGARTELFGDIELMKEIAHDSHADGAGEGRYYRGSRYPHRRTSGYFLENPTLVMRVDAFRRLGGYADFGEGRRNRTGVDTDFQLRAYYSRAAVAVTNDVLVRYRCHGDSATNDATSGFGSRAHLESHAEVRRRLLRYATGTFDPRWFGALGQHNGVTRRL